MSTGKNTRRRDIMIFVAVVLAAIVALYVYKPLNEWSGDVDCATDEGARKKVALPLAISKIFYYQTSESGPRQTWVAFSGDKNAIGQYLAGRLKVTPSEGIAWPGAASQRERAPIPPPPRPAWRNWGYWNIPADASGMVIHKKLDSGTMDVFYDTKNSRLYFRLEG